MSILYLIVVWVADSLPPLHRDVHDEEDAGREGEVTAALKEGEDEGEEAVIQTKVKRQDQKIGNQEKNICDAEARKQLVEQICH